MKSLQKGEQSPTIQLHQPAVNRRLLLCELQVYIKVNNFLRVSTWIRERFLGCFFFSYAPNATVVHQFSFRIRFLLKSISYPERTRTIDRASKYCCILCSKVPRQVGRYFYFPEILLCRQVQLCRRDLTTDDADAIGIQTTSFAVYRCKVEHFFPCNTIVDNEGDCVGVGTIKLLVASKLRILDAKLLSYFKVNFSNP